MHPNAQRLRDDADAMRQALLEHGSDRAVAEAVGVSEPSVRRWRRRHGIAAVGRQAGPSVPPEAARLRDDADAMRAALAEHGRSRAVAAAVGVSASAIVRWRRRHGIPATVLGGRSVPPEAARLRDDADAMRAALAEHGSDRDIAAACGVGRTSIGRWRRAHGLDPATVSGGRSGDRSVPPEAARLRDDADAMRAALAEHGSDRDIAAAYGVGRTSIRSWRRGHGIPAPSPGPQGRKARAEAARLRDDADAMRAALAEHGSDAKVAAAVGVSPWAVSRWRDGHGISPVGLAWEPDAAARLRDDADAMWEALNQCGSDGLVAEAVGVHIDTVREWRLAHGLPAVARSGRRAVPPAARRLREDADAMRAAIAEHGANGDVAAAVGVDASTIGRWRAAHGIPAGPRAKAVPDAAARLRDDADALRAALNEHGSARAVAAAVGVSSTSMRRWRDAHGIDPVTLD